MGGRRRDWLKIRWPRASRTVIGVMIALFAFALFALYDSSRGALGTNWGFSATALLESWSGGAMHLQLSVINLLIRPGSFSLGIFWSSFKAVLGPSWPTITCVVGIATAGWSLGLIEEDRGSRSALTLVVSAALVGGVAAMLTQQSGIAASPVAFCALGALLYTRRHIGVGLGHGIYVSGPAAHLALAGLSLVLGLAFGVSYLLTVWASWFTGARLARGWGDEVSIHPILIDTPISADGIVVRSVRRAAPDGAWLRAARTTLIRGREAGALAARSGIARARTEASARMGGWKESKAAERESAPGTGAGLCCADCGAPTSVTDLFCGACGARTLRRAVLQRRSAGRDWRATKTLLGMAAYFVLSGLVGFWVSNVQIEETLKTGEQYAAHDEIVLENGDTVVVAEWREELELEPYLVIVVYAAIAALFLLLGLWARWSPFAALCVGAGLYASIVVLEIIGEPESWYRGIYLRVVIVVALVRAIQHARSELRQTVQAVPAE